MNSMVTWIGGATAALVLVFSGASLAGAMMDGDGDTSAEAKSIEQAIPVDPAAVEKSADPEFVTEEVVQPLPEKEAEPKDERFVVKRILDIDGPIKYGDWYWDTEGVPEGPLVITVDLDARVISIFRDGYEIGAAAAMLGTDDHPTPLGTFPILTKERHNVSEKYGNAPMPWTLRLTWDGIAIHGGSEVENGYASHGCIAIPDELASRLFAIAKKGDKVIITRGETMGMGDEII
ncbi:L,D-transpeptidase family protein [Erythrobacter sp. HKB08]|uniref:L,D-transpeptidase family protein n=1 Tax=Erythrobacter sp. HKB08 TaxID=2502843 RepID=UPI001008C1DA|nr:L,D-transpeptidase family protein [Erythrobacter sp. HKB08]